MKKISIIVFVIVINACQFNQSVNKDLTTGAYSRGNGLGSDDVQIEINGQLENRNTFIHGEKVNFLFNNLKGLKKIEGRTYPGLSIGLIDKNKDTILSEADLFKDNTDGFDLPTIRLNAHFVAIMPLGKDYEVFIKIWDKKGDGTYTYTMPFEVEANKLLEITSSNIDYENIYLWNNSKKLTVTDKNIDVDDTYILIPEKLKGLKNVDGKVYPIFSIDIEDKKGNKILTNPNVLSKYSSEGLSEQDFISGQVPITINFTKGRISNPCTLTAILTDKNSSNNLKISVELVIE